MRVRWTNQSINQYEYRAAARFVYHHVKRERGRTRTDRGMGRNIVGRTSSGTYTTGASDSDESESEAGGGGGGMGLWTFNEGDGAGTGSVEMGGGGVWPEEREMSSAGAAVVKERPRMEGGRAVGGSDGVMGSSGSSTRNGSGTSGSTSGGETTAMSESSDGGDSERASG